MSCGRAGRTRYIYTGNQVGYKNQVGAFGYTDGGPPGSGQSSSTTVGFFYPNTLHRRLWERRDAVMNDTLLDACYPTINLQWTAEITFSDGLTFRVSDRSFYVQDKDGLPRYYDARADKAPAIVITLGEWLNPNYSISDLTLSLNNRDGFYNKYLPHGAEFRQWSDAHIVIKIGFGENYDNYFALFEGQVTIKEGLTTTRDTIELRCYDKLSLDDVPVPSNMFSADIYPDIGDTDSGAPIPLIYGDWTENVPVWGSLIAFCVNANEADPDSYSFKISDLELASINSVWLHRGERTSESVAGPIRISADAITESLTDGSFTLDARVPVLDEPAVLVSAGKAAEGSDLNLLTSNSDTDFIAIGVKVGDTVLITSETASSLNAGNLKFVSVLPGMDGDAITIETYLLGIDDNSDASKAARTHPLITVSGTAITIGFRQHRKSYDPLSGDYSTILVTGDTAGQIRTALSQDTDAKALVKASFIGTVPGGYLPYTSVSAVSQDVFGPSNLASGQNDLLPCVVLTVANYQLTLSGDVTFHENDSYSILTNQYTYKSGDKFSVVASGKPLNLTSVTRIKTATDDIVTPTALSVASDSTYWVSDDTTQKIYNITFDGEVLSTIDYADIDASIARVSGVSRSPDSYIWVTDPDSSTIYRYSVADSLTNLVIPTSVVTGIGATLGYLAGVVAKQDTNIWIVDRATSHFYEIAPFGTLPEVVRDYDSSAFDATATNIANIGFDEVTEDLLIADQTNLIAYRVLAADGSLVSQVDLTEVSSNFSLVTGIAGGLDGTMFFLDATNQIIYNYNDDESVSTNPCWIARDMLQKFGNHSYEEFDLSWNTTARQLSGYKARAAIMDSDTLVAYLNKLLRQFNVVFHQRFGKYALIWLTFDNFRSDGRLVKEKDIKEQSFKPGKEPNQYFNSATTTYANDPFKGDPVTSDTYFSSAGIAFAGQEVNKKLESPNIYRRTEVDQLMPLFVRLATPEPEFVDSTFGFRVIRTQMQDFLRLTFDGNVNIATGLKESGRRYDNVPAMVRKMTYDLDAMTLTMHLWSLGNTKFPGYTPAGRTVGGDGDPVVLTTVGRLGHVSPVGTVAAYDTAAVTLEDVDAEDAETRTAASTGLAWKPGYRVALVDGETKEILQTLTIDGVAGGIVTFVEDITATMSNTSKNGAGFITGGVYLSWANYDATTEAQKALCGSFSNPSSAYPTSKTREIEEQRSGAHNFDDGGIPYVLYPNNYVSY